MGLIDLVFPKNCFACQKPGGYLCSECVQNLKPARVCCPMCGHFNYQGKTHFSCRQKWGMEGKISCFSYQGPIRQALVQMKYHFSYKIAEELARVCLNEVKNYTQLINTCAFVSMATKTQRLNWRGFNQAEIIARVWADKLNIPFMNDVLIKCKSTLPQARLDKTQRAKNINNAFATNSHASAKLSSYENIFLVDDVWTTGSTMREATKVLKKAGAKNVWGITIAG